MKKENYFLNDFDKSIITSHFKAVTFYFDNDSRRTNILIDHLELKNVRDVIACNCSSSFYALNSGQMRNILKPKSLSEVIAEISESLDKRNLLLT